MSGTDNPISSTTPRIFAVTQRSELRSPGCLSVASIWRSRGWRWHNDRVYDLDSSARAGRDGDDVALERFVRAVQTDVWRFAAYLTHPDESDDLAQEALIRVIENLHRWERGPVHTWVLGVTRNVCREHIRKRVNRRTDPVAQPDVAHSPDQTDAVDTIQLLRALPRDQREAIVLTQLIGLSYAEAAAVSDCPIGTIRSRVARARTALVEALGDDPVSGHG